MFSFNNKDLKFRKSQLPMLVLAFAPFLLNGTDFNKLFTRDKNIPNISPVTAQALIDGKAIKLEVANNPITQAAGLTHRADIDLDRAMLYQTSISKPLAFSGEGMEFSTDLIFIMGNKVVGSYSNVKPCTNTAPTAPNISTANCPKYSLERKYNQVLEVKAGIIEKLEVKNDTQVDISYLLKK
jgi:uncharacterized membrane protein (UPF0127 family)